MISAVQGRFASLGMAKKMGIGFTLVLLLTGLVAAIGVWSLQAISLRFDGLKQMSSLNSSLLKVRLLEQDYALHSNPKTVDALHEGVDGLTALAQTLKAQSPANVAIMNDVEQALAAYRKAFDEFVGITQAKDLALEMASWSVSSVANNLDVLQAGLADDGSYTLKQSQGQEGNEFLEQAAQVSHVSQLMLQAMNEAHVRLDQSRKGDEESQGKIEQADQALAGVEQLKTSNSRPRSRTPATRRCSMKSVVISPASMTSSPSTPACWSRKSRSISNCMNARPRWSSGSIRPMGPRTSRCRLN